MRIYILFPVLLLGLTACDSGNNVTTGTPAVNGLKKLVIQKANSEPGAIVDAIQLQDDINALFNGAIPVEVKPSDSIQDVIDRAEGS